MTFWCRNDKCPFSVRTKMFVTQQDVLQVKCRFRTFSDSVAGRRQTTFIRSLPLPMSEQAAGNERQVSHRSLGPHHGPRCTGHSGLEYEKYLPAATRPPTADARQGGQRARCSARTARDRTRSHGRVCLRTPPHATARHRTPPHRTCNTPEDPGQLQGNSTTDMLCPQQQAQSELKGYGRDEIGRGKTQTGCGFGQHWGTSEVQVKTSGVKEGYERCRIEAQKLCIC